MSNFLAIATVTATLRRVLLQAIPADVTGADVTHIRPAENTGNNSTGLPSVLGVNLYLYQISYNPHWRNADLPTRRSDGDLAQKPQAALDLHYMFSFYGDESKLEPQRLLGSTVAYFHSQPLLTRAQIQLAVSDATLDLAQSDLADQIELVRFTPLSLSLEEMSRLWSVFFQVKHVLSVAYQASVVLVEPRVIPRVALPTRDFNLRALPISQPYIQRIVSQSGADEPILAGGAIYIEGLRLQGEITRVDIYGQNVAVDEIRPARIALTLPGTLYSGVQQVQVRQGVKIGAPGEPHLTFASNLGVFVLRPQITKNGSNYNIGIANLSGSGSVPRSAAVTVTLLPQVAPRQQVTLEILTLAGEVAYTFLANSRSADTDQVTFAISGVTAGDYLFRIRVDGAESLFDLDGNQKPIAPKESIP
jgi:hypothetical protein